MRLILSAGVELGGEEEGRKALMSSVRLLLAEEWQCTLQLRGTHLLM